MQYADASELIAEMILKPHNCGPDCLCWELRTVPAVDEALQKLGGLPPYETLNEFIEKMATKAR